MNIGYDTDTTNIQKQALIDLMKDLPLQTLQIAFLYARNYVEYGEDVTKTWVTATENVSILGKAYRKGYYDAMEKLEGVAIPSAEPKWIPVSERLPKENEWYQCTVIVNGLSRTMEMFYKNGKWLDNRRISMFDTYDIYGYGITKEKHKLSYQELISEFEWSQVVIAWKPLSQPYKAEGRIRNDRTRN